MITRKSIMPAVVLLFSLLLGGCNEVLYSELEEEQANLIVAVLSENGINATREKLDKSYRVTVAGRDFARAVRILQANNLPGKKYLSFEELFPSGGMVKSKSEEHYRFLFALQEDLSRTISGLESVRTARVHVMLPEDVRFPGAEKVDPKASVVIHVRDGEVPDFITGAAKRIVSHAVKGLSYDRVSVTIVGENLKRTSKQASPEYSGQSLKPENSPRDEQRWPSISSSAGLWQMGLLFLTIFGSVFLLRFLFGRKV